jgi:hypothetical protein
MRIIVLTEIAEMNPMTDADVIYLHDELKKPLVSHTRVIATKITKELTVYSLASLHTR